MRIDVMLPLTLSALLMTATIGGSALALDRDGDREAAALQGAKVSLTQAVAVAEQQTGGQAFDAGVDTRDGQTRIVVETNGPGGIHTVSVDPQSGGFVGTHAGGEED